MCRSRWSPTSAPSPLASISDIAHCINKSVHKKNNCQTKNCCSSVGAADACPAIDRVTGYLISQGHERKKLFFCFFIRRHRDSTGRNQRVESSSKGRLSKVDSTSLEPTVSLSLSLSLSLSFIGLGIRWLLSSPRRRPSDRKWATWNEFHGPNDLHVAR